MSVHYANPNPLTMRINSITSVTLFVLLHLFTHLQVFAYTPGDNFISVAAPPKNLTTEKEHE